MPNEAMKAVQTVASKLNVSESVARSMLSNAEAQLNQDEDDGEPTITDVMNLALDFYSL